MLDLNYYKTKLEKQLEVITVELKEIGVYDAQNDNWEAVADQEESAADADENESADFTEEWDERTATLSALESEYRDLKRALAKIDNGAYGICEICGNSIEEKRLEARLDARTCIAHMNDETQLPL
jgi:RNA polymerase-binding transcription factor DksA